MYEKFSIVLIYEHLDESLLLMKRRFCWQLDDILHLKFHYTSPNIWNRKETPSDVAEMIRRWNAADVSLYDFFNKTLWEEIKYEGDNFWNELREFKHMQNMIENDCLVGHDDGDKFILDDIPTEVPPTTKSQKLLKILKGRRDFQINPSKLFHINQNNETSESSQHKISDIYENLTDSKSLTKQFQNKTLRDILAYANLIDNTKQKTTSKNIRTTNIFNNNTSK